MRSLPIRHRAQRPIALAVIAALAIGVATPTIAASPDGARDSSRAFRHHFYRGQPKGARDRGAWDRGAWDDDRGGGAFGALGAGLAGLAFAPALGTDDAAAERQEAEAYCSDRFRSYDPATGTYLGYDGAAHPCP